MTFVAGDDKVTNNTRKQFVIDDFVGVSAWCEYVRQRVKQVADSHLTVLVQGPSGTGKELIARALHNHSSRKDQPFVPVNCAAVPGELFASQLFGHAKGAFTGADHPSLGCFRAADTGTIFLDEIGELCLENQAKLLRVLQERVVTPVGDHEGTPINVRTIVATNRDLQTEVQSGRFRLDLFYRLNAIDVITQSIRERVEDIEALAKHFLAKTAIELGDEIKSISDDAWVLLKSHDWPGNVRELENTIERAAVLSDGRELTAHDFRDLLTRRIPSTDSFSISDPWSRPQQQTTHFVDKPNASSPMFPSNSWMTLADLEKEHIRKTLQQAAYNQSAAARLLGVDRKLLARKIKKYGLTTPPSGPL